MSTTITGLPNATTPLTGAERVPMDQAGATKDASTQDIANLAPGTDLSYNAATRQLSSSTGAHVTLPLAGADAGLLSVADKVKVDSLGAAASRNVGTTAGTVAAGDDSRFAELAARLNAFRDAAAFYVSKSGSDTANGTSPGEALLTVAAAVTAANAYATANPGARIKISIGPGEFTETGLPFRLKPNILVQGALQRGTIIKPTSGQELLGFFALDSGCMVCDLRFAGHQATGTSNTDSTVGTRAWAVRLNELANAGQGVILTASPYIKDCASITAEDDAGLGGSTSTGDTGGGVLVDGAACHPTSPLRSILCYGFTQQNLGGPGCVVRNDAYAELVSFFGLFGTWHVQCETGGQATLSGGGCSEFGIYGLVADGYSSTALYTGSLRVAASSSATTVDVVSLSANRLGSSSRPAPGQIMLLGSNPYVVQSSSPIDATGSVVADTAPTRAGYRVAFYNPSGTGLAGNVAQGATADFRQRSQISAGCHSANYVGSGTNYSALPWNGGVPVRGNEAVERNLGRVFGLIVNDVGDVRIAGGAFAVDGTTGAVTINTSQFNLSGLNAIGPFSRNGGASTVGVQLQEVSNSASLLASTGISDGNTAPTQFAVRSYADGRFLAGLTATAGQPLTVSDTSTQDGAGFWTRSRNIELSLNAPNGLARLDGSGLIPAALLPSYVDDVLEFANLAAFPATGESGKIYVARDNGKTYRWSGSTYIETSASPGSTDAVPEGSVNLYFSQARARQSISAGGSLSYDSATGVISYTAPTLASVALSGTYSDLSGRPTLGTAAALNVGTSAGNVVQLDGTGRLPAIDGSQLTNMASLVGPQGPAGPTGPAGATGPQGAAGSSAYQVAVAGGFVGTEAQWLASLVGPQGPAGATGAQGPQGAAGPAGATGAAGPQGQAGVVAATAPITYDSGTQTVGISAATTSAAGSMSAADKTKLDGIATGATANATDAQLRDRSTHTGTQAASTITGLATVATSGAYSDLSGRPTLGTAAPLDVAATGDASSAQVVKGNDSRLSDARTPLAHTQTASTISDSTAAGRALLTAADATAQRTSLGLGTFATANAASPPAIGGTTPAAGSFTNLSASAELQLPNGAPGTPIAGDIYRSADTLRYLDSGNVERLLLNATDNLAGLANVATARTNLGAAASGAITSSGLTQATARILGRSTAGTGAVEEISLPTGFDLSSGALRAPTEIGLACSDETTALTAGTAKLTFRMPYAMTLTAVRLSVTTAPTGSALIADVNEGGVSVFSTNPRIDAGATTSVGSGTPAVISDASLADNALITIDIDQIGATVAGVGLKVWLIGRRA